MMSFGALAQTYSNAQDLTWAVSLGRASRLLSVERLGLFPIVIACQAKGAKGVDYMFEA